MDYLSPWRLIGLAALVVPVILHLLQRKRIIKLPFSTLRFLKAVAARTSRRSRLENILLLLLRCLTISALVLAAAQPVVSPSATTFFGGDVLRTIVLVLDNSMSMGCRIGDDSRLDIAKRQALAILEDLRPGDDVAVLAVNDRVRFLIAEPTVDHALARQAVQAVRPTVLGSDFSVAFREAQKIVARSKRGVRRVCLLTDSQQTGWGFAPAAVFDEPWRGNRVQLVIVRPDELAPANAGISRVEFRTPFVVAGANARGVVRIENHADTPLQTVLEVNLAGARVAQRAVDVPARGSAEVPVEFVVPALEGRFVRGTARLQADNLAADDEFVFCLPVFQPPRVLVVEGHRVGNKELHAAFYLRKALTAGNATATDVIDAAALEDASLENYSAVMMADVPRLGDRAAVRLGRYVESGGTIALFFGDQSEPAQLERLGFLPATAHEVRQLPAGRVVVRAAQPQHPLFLNTWDAETPFPALPQQKVFEWELAPAASVLLTIGDGQPFVIVGNRELGRVVLVNASADRSWGDFPLSPAFVPLVQQIARWSAEQTSLHRQFLVGRPLPVLAGLPRDQAVSVTLPDGQEQRVEPGSAVLLERAELSGVYEVNSMDNQRLQELVANVDPVESDLRAFDERTLWPHVEPHSVAGMDSLRVWLEKNSGLKPLWPLLLVLALVFFGTDAVLANLMARNRTQGNAIHTKTGRLVRRQASTPFRAADLPAEVGSGGIP